MAAAPVAASGERIGELLMREGLITREDFEQKKEMILDAPLDPADDVEALRGARALVEEELLTEPEYDVLKRKILKFGK